MHILEKLQVDNNKKHDKKESIKISKCMAPKLFDEREK